MKKRCYLITILLIAGLCISCGKQETESEKNSNSQAEEIQDQSELKEQAESEGQSEAEVQTVSGEQPESDEQTVSGKQPESDEQAKSVEVITPDFEYDYTEDIKADVESAVSNASSLQNELKNIDLITEKYMPLATEAQSQLDMNRASNWLFTIWDTELNNLWERFSNLADQETKDRILTEQRNWIAMKDEITLLSIGSSEGSIYPLLYNSLWEEKTKNRAYYLANELAKIKGEAFTLPETSLKYGLYVDSMGSDGVYSSLFTQEGWQEEDEADISIYRLGQLTGTFVDNGDGELIFTSDDENVKGIIKIDGWNGASFEVTEVHGASIFTVGDTFEFPYLY